jgi:hypothetical protein
VDTGDIAASRLLEPLAMTWISYACAMATERMGSACWDKGGRASRQNRRMRKASGGLVYSTEGGRMCPACRHPIAQCVCGKASAPAGDGNVRVWRETKGRGGKAVTLVKGSASS